MVQRGSRLIETLSIRRSHETHQGQNEPTNSQDESQATPLLTRNNVQMGMRYGLPRNTSIVPQKIGPMALLKVVGSRTILWWCRQALGQITCQTHHMHGRFFGHIDNAVVMLSRYYESMTWSDGMDVHNDATDVIFVDPTRW